MAEAIVSDIVVRVLAHATGSIAERIAPYFSGREKLDELHETMSFIQERLSYAERQHEGERGDFIRKWLEELKCVMYRLEDLFEEVDANDRKNEQRQSSSKLSKVVHFLPPKLSSLRMNKKVAKEGESILSKLNRLKETMNVLLPVPDPREVNVGDSKSGLNLVDTRKTYSFTPKGKIIGRDKDRDVIVDMLLKAKDVDEVLSVIPIVGMGGLGKTALAQIVYNDQRVQRLFENKYWACISDKISSLEELIGKVFQSMTMVDGWKQWNLEKLQCEFREVVKEKTFLLVLDDVWDLDINWWVELKGLLCECKLDSVVLVTTRSHAMASNMSTVEPYYKLRGLSDDQSWALFKSLAFRKGQEESYPNLVNIGQEIMQKCSNVPLAIRTIAGLLYSRNTEKEWAQFRDKEIGMIDHKENIMSTLRLSYCHLQPRQKKCFAYCSLYPKDYEFNIKDLIWRWMAQGFVRSMDDGHECFMELQRRCFFQDVTIDEYGTMEGCKMHDLMHDLAKSVGTECLILDKPVQIINGNIRHVAVIIDDEDSHSPLEASWMRSSPPIRSFSLSFGSLLNPDVIFSHLRRLRVLDLGESRYESLPDSIGRLQHLRYLKAKVGCLPEGITALQNLQFLDVVVKNVPRDFHKLTSLRHLEIGSPTFKGWMPPGIGKLLNLESLNAFVVGNEGLDALAELNLTGKLIIDFRENRENAISEAKMSNLKGKKLTHLKLMKCSDTFPSEDEHEVLHSLQLPSTLEILEVDGLRGVRHLSWGIHDLPNIVCITIYGCHGIQQLPSLGGLPLLKRLKLEDNYGLEFIENGSGNNNETIAFSSEAGAIYFPSLEMLELHGLYNLERWSRIEGTDVDQQVEQCQPLRRCFPRLRTLKMLYCERLRSMPWSQFAALNYKMPQMLENLEIARCVMLDLSPWENLQSLCSLSLRGIYLPPEIATLTRLQSLEIVSTNIVPEWIGQLAQLQSLSIVRCNTETLPRSIRDLNTLKELHILRCPELTSRCVEPDGEYWPLIQHIPLVYLSDLY